MGPDRLDELIAHPVERVEARQRVLKDHADALAPDLAHLIGRESVDPRAREPDLAARDAARRIDEADNGGPRHGFAGARLAHDPEHLAAGDVEGDAVDRGERAATGHEFNLQLADGQNGWRHGMSNGFMATGQWLRHIPPSVTEREPPGSAPSLALRREGAQRLWPARP